MLSEMLRDPKWMQKDLSVIMAMGLMYMLFLIAIATGQRRKRVDDKYFVEAIKSE